MARLKDQRAAASAVEGVSRRRVLGPIIGAAAIVLAVGGVTIVREWPSKPLRRTFDLVDSRTGQEVTDQSFAGRWLLVFFGYTHCPDICPTTLSDIAQAMSELGPLAGQVQPLFITVDPLRDSATTLAEYTAAFDPRIVGLTGTGAQIAAAARSYGVYYARRDVADDYFVDHSASVYVMRPDGAYADAFPVNAGSTVIADRLRHLLSVAQRAAERSVHLTARRTGP